MLALAAALADVQNERSSNDEDESVGAGELYASSNIILIGFYALSFITLELKEP